jgi:hypothetical protein
MAKNSARHAVGVLGTAGTGALAGAPFGPIGALVGAGVGGLAGGIQNLIADRPRKQAEAMAKKQKLLAKKGGNPGEVPGERTGNFWSGYNDYTSRFPLHGPEQIAANNALLPRTVERLQGNEFDFTPIEERSNQNFQKKVLPGIAHLFSKYPGGSSSSGYQSVIGSAAAEHQLGLNALRQEYGLQQQTQQQNLLNTLMQPQYQTIYHPPTQGFGQSLATNILPQLASAGIQYGIPALVNAYGNKQQTPQTPTTAGLVPGAPQTIGSASTPAGQATEALAQSGAKQNVLGGVGANKGGLTTAGKAGLSGAALVGGLALTNWLKNLAGGNQ